MTIGSRIRFSRTSMVALALAVTLMGTSDGAAGGRLARDLQALQFVAGDRGQVDVIIMYAGSPAAAQKERLRGRGATAVRELRLVRGVSATVPVASLGDLAEDPDVVRVSWDEPVSAATDVSVPTLGGWLVREVTGVDGSGVRIAVIDSGVEPVAGLGAGPGAPLGRIVAWVDLLEPHRPSPTDPYGHGTHVAGIIAGGLQEIRDPAGRNATYGGVAPGAEIVSVRVLDREGRGRASDVIAGIQWVTERAEELNIRIVNLSLGHPVREPAADDPLVRACEEAWSAGLLVVTSAGNRGREAGSLGTISSPGNSANVVTVGATVDWNTLGRSDDTVATYSSQGPTRFDGIIKPDLLAPGDAIVSARSPQSTLDRSFSGNRVGSTSRGASSPELFVLSGTSMAAAAVSGGAALLLSTQPDLDPETIKARLMRSAEKRDESIWARGAGALDLAAALDDQGRAAASASPAAGMDDGGVHMDGSGSWGGDGWNASDVYGPESLWDLELAWDLLQETEPSDAAPLIWQVPPTELGGGGVLWTRVPGPSPESVVWQLDAESVVWQRSANAVGPESVVWQVDSQSVVWQVDSQSVVWQVDSQSVVWQSDLSVSAESVVWQRTTEETRILVQGEGGLEP